MIKITRPSGLPAVLGGTVVLLSFVTASMPVHAATDAASGIAWRCTQEFDSYYSVQCIPNQTAAGDAPLRPPAEARASAPHGFGAHDMRPVAARGDAEVFSTRAWRIPLYTRPGDAQAVSRLLEAVLCDNVPQCTVHYDGTPSALPR